MFEAPVTLIRRTAPRSANSSLVVFNGRELLYDEPHSGELFSKTLYDDLLAPGETRRPRRTTKAEWSDIDERTRFAWFSGQSPG
jgi:hypothetical protein